MFRWLNRSLKGRRFPISLVSSLADYMPTLVNLEHRKWIRQICFSTWILPQIAEKVFWHQWLWSLRVMEVKTKRAGRYLPEVFYPQSKFHVDDDDQNCDSRWKSWITERCTGNILECMLYFVCDMVKKKEAKLVQVSCYLFPEVLEGY